MARYVDFEGSNQRLGPPPGHEDTVGAANVFTNGRCCVMCWEFSDAEIEEIVRTRRLFVSSLSGRTMAAQFCAPESVMHEFLVDEGGTFKRTIR